MTITQKDIEGHLNFLRNGHGDSTVMVNCEYLVAVLQLALDSFSEPTIE